MYDKELLLGVLPTVPLVALFINMTLVAIIPCHLCGTEKVLKIEGSWLGLAEGVMLGGVNFNEV